MRLNPGDRVRITEYAFENPDVVGILVATKDSIGTVLSHQEFCGYCVNNPKEHYFLSVVRSLINDGTQYPIRFDTVVPPSKDFLSDWGERTLHIECAVGKIEILHIKFLEKLA